MDESLAEEALRDILPQAQPRQVTIRLIQEVVSQYYDLDIKDFKIRKRTKAIAFPRQIAMYLCRELTDASLPRIGEEFGGRDHTTVMHAHDKVAHDRQRDPHLNHLLEELARRLRNR